MLRLNNGFIGYTPNSTYRFIGGDKDTLYSRNLKTKPADWYYRDRPITYVNNSFGHRSPDVKDIDLNNYILFVGCSHTEGVGNYLEDTYAHMVSKEANIDYYNLSIGGSGIDTMLHNLSVWLTTVNSSPKHIIWQWTDPVRYVTVMSDDLVITHGMWEDTKEVQDFVIAGDTNGFFKSRNILASNYLHQLKTNVIEVTHIEKNSPDKIFCYAKDHARDNQHYGVLSNKHLAEMILQKIST